MKNKYQDLDKKTVFDYSHNERWCLFIIRPYTNQEEYEEAVKNNPVKRALDLHSIAEANQDDELLKAVEARWPDLFPEPGLE